MTLSSFFFGFDTLRPAVFGDLASDVAVDVLAFLALGLGSDESGVFGKAAVSSVAFDFPLPFSLAALTSSTFGLSQFRPMGSRPAFFRPTLSMIRVATRAAYKYQSDRFLDNVDMSIRRIVGLGWIRSNPLQRPKWRYCIVSEDRLRNTTSCTMDWLYMIDILHVRFFSLICAHFQLVCDIYESASLPRIACWTDW